MLSSSDDEDDPVVKEIDLYLAKGLAEKLLLFQYPVRPSNATYDHTPHMASRIKPVQQKVELELGIDTISTTYCYPRGEQIAYAVDRDERGANQKPHFPSSVMDRQRLSSVKATDDSSKYAAAIYSNDSIHITPIKGIYQLHPSFTYFDKAEENNKKAAATLISNDDNQTEDEQEEAKPVQLRFSKGDNHKKKVQQQVTNLEEKWVETQFYQPQDRRAIMERNLLLCHQSDFESPEFTVTSRDYLKILSPSEQQGVESPADLPHGVLSLLKLKGMNLSDQIKALLITAKVLQFTQLCALLGGGMDSEAVLTALTQYSMLVQGCWVVKSNILYPEGTKSHISGLDASKLWPSRDYVLFCFNRKRVLSRKEVSSNTRIPTEELREVLEQIGKQRPAQGWEFMLNTDNEFLRGYPEECSNQLLMWKKCYKEITEALNVSEEFSESDWNESNFPGLFPGIVRKPISRRRVPSQSSGLGSETEKSKPKSRRRTKSQSSQDALVLPEVKNEVISPVKNITSNQLTGSEQCNTKLAVSLHQHVSTKKVHKPNLKSSKVSPVKSSTNTKEKNDKEKKLGKTDNKSNTESDVSKKTTQVVNSKNLSKDKVESNVLPEKMDIDIVSKQSEKHVQFTGSSKVIRPSLTEPDNEIGENIVSQKRKKKTRAIISDDESDDEMTVDITHTVPEKVIDIYVEDSSFNEIEVSNDNAEEIFVPPIAAGGRTISDDNERPPSEIFIKELKKFCREAIQSGCLCLKELKEVLHMRQQEPGNILCTGVSDELLVKCAKDSGAIEVPIKWQEPSNIPEDRKQLFLYRLTGDNTDKYRSILIDLFSESQSLRRKDIFEAFNRVLKEGPSSHIYTKVISEFCQNHHGQWYLNGTFTTIQKYSNS